MIGRGLFLSALGALTLALSACSTQIPDTQRTLQVVNGTTITVSIVIAGTNVGMVTPQTLATFHAADLPPLPWHVVAVSPSNRELLELDVPAGRVFANGAGGVGQRHDLSCGRLDVYSGPPLMGPMPGPGVPGDCD